MGILEEEIPGTYEEFGDYYIAEELLRSEDNSNNSDILVVAETLNVRQETEMAIFMWLTTDIDIRFYVRNYEMSSFGNLVKFDPNAPFHYDTLTVASVHRRAAVSMFTAGALEDLDNMTILGGLQRNDSGMSVASAGKMKISSIGGAVDDAQVFEDNKFYIREALYTKFTLIIEKLLSVDFYLRKDTETINFIYNTGNLPSGAQAIQAASNVFMVKYCLAEKTFPMPRLFNAVVAMFCAYPDKDYGMMVLSNKARNIRSHVELMQYFMPVASRPSAETNLDEVFITHRSTIFGEISLYKLRREDVSVVLGLASSNMDDPKPGTGSQGSSVSYCSKVNENLDTENELDVLRAIMKEVLDTNFSQFSVFTIRVGNSTKSAKENTPVGFVVLRQFHDHNKLHDHYYLPKLEAHLDRLRAQIISLRIHPLFMGSADLIFRDLAKKTNFYDFYSITSNSDQMLSNDLKKMMMVLEPRHVKKSPTLFKPHKEPKRATTYVELRNHNYAKDHLIIYRHKLNPVKWFTNTNKIVILGFSSVAKAFLRQLIFLWNSKDQKNMDSYTCLTRVQVTLICEPGIVEAEYDNLFQCPYCSQSRKCYLSYSNRSCFIRDCCYRMDLRHWVHFIPGKVQAINRANKLVKLEGACEITYDTLFLCCDQNFVLQSPNESIENTPCNFVEINSRLAKFMLFYKVRALLEEMPRSYMILIYGDNLSVYECIGFLMNHGVDCSRIVFVKPHRFIGFSEEDKMKNPFWDKNIQLILDDMLGNNGLEIIEDHAFKHWVLRESTDFIMQVVFQHFPSRKHTSFECDLFISFGEGHMVPRHKQIFEASSIQLDNNYIVINEKFQTNDPNIYAAGRFVKIMPEPNYQYKYTSAREVAVKLLHHLGISPRADFDLRYELPYHFQAMLPLNYFITKVVLPVRYLSIQPVGSLKCSLTTYKNQTFCRVGLNNSMLVDEIVVVTKKVGCIWH
ncbi:hypothetical protein KR018_004134 [Drosophila ironensis]|nr:hypothetical protein KR018_004134 [Drosophila ironensis]